MTQAPPGWYPDPQGPAAVRWWDGSSWTEHVSSSTYLPAPAATPTTPDGVPLATWGRRLAAYVTDSFIVSVLVLLVGLPLLIHLVHVEIDWVNEAMDAPAGEEPDIWSFYGRIWGPELGLAAIGLALQLAYQAGFLRWKQATPGKLLLGLRVRRRDVAGPLPWSTILRRIFGQLVLAVVPFWAWVDGLWPLWDDKRQALHDKIADTNVVVTPRRP